MKVYLKDTKLLDQLILEPSLPPPVVGSISSIGKTGMGMQRYFIKPKLDFPKDINGDQLTISVEKILEGFHEDIKAK